MFRNRASNIMVIAALPNVKKTFLSLYLSITEPVIHIDFAHKNLKERERVFKKFNMDVYSAPPDKVSAELAVKCLREVRRGTIVLDDFSFLPEVDQTRLAWEILEKPNEVKINIVSHAYNKIKRHNDAYLSVSLPTVLLPLDKRLIDFLFIRESSILMLGRTEEKWDLSGLTRG